MRSVAIYLLCVSTLSATLIPTARLSDWHDNAGVPGGYEQYLPGGSSARTVLHDVTQPPYNADNTGVADASSAIQAALDACAGGQVVYLPAGIYRLNSTLQHHSSITIRGEVDSNKIPLAHLDIHANTGILLNGSMTRDFCLSTVVSGLTAGSTSLVVSDPTGGGHGEPFASNRFAQVTWRNDPAVPVINAAGDLHTRTFDCIITNVSGSTITFTPPLPGAFGNASTAVIYQQPTGYTYGNLSGIEDLDIVAAIVTATPSSGGSGYLVNDVLTVTGGNGLQLHVDSVSSGAVQTASIINPGYYGEAPNQPANVTGGHGSGATFNLSSNMNFGVTFNVVARSWVKNVNIVNQTNYGTQWADVVQSTLTHSWVKHGGSGSNHSGMLFNTVSASLVYDNISDRNYPNFEVNSGTTGCVFSYNILPGNSNNSIDTNHGPHNSYNLYEGNIVQCIQAGDGFFGSVSEDTIFRGWITSVNADDNSITFSMAMKRFTRNVSLVGNIIQSAGHTWSNDGIDTSGSPNTGNGASNGHAPPWRDINSDGTTPYLATLTTRTDNLHGVFTLTSGTGSNLIGGGPGSFRNDEFIRWRLPNSLTLGNILLVSLSGNDLTVDASPFSQNLPALSTAVEIWASPGGFQELDDDVAATFVRRVNYYYWTNNIPSGEALGADTFPDSLYLNSKPTWFHALAWPPFDPQNPGTPQNSDIPAGYRFENNGADPPDAAGGDVTFVGSGTVAFIGAGTVTFQ